MPPLPVLSGREVVKAFETLGWYVVRQRGSHVIMVNDSHGATLSIPQHRTVARGTLRSLIRVAKISVAEFNEASK